MKTYVRAMFGRPKSSATFHGNPFECVQNQEEVLPNPGGSKGADCREEQEDCH